MKQIADSGVVPFYKNWSESSNSDGTGYMNYVPYLVENNYNDFTNNLHREEVAQYDPYAKFICWDIPRSAFKDSFKFIDNLEKKVSLMDDPEFIELYNTIVCDLELLEIFAIAYSWERIDGKSYLLLHFNNNMLDALGSPVRKGSKLVAIEPLKASECKPIDFDKKNRPTKYGLDIKVRTSDGEEDKEFSVDASRILEICTKPINRNRDGMSALKPVWNPLTQMRNMFYSMMKYGIRFGSPPIDITIKSADENEIKDKATDFKKVSMNNVNLHGDDTEIQFLTGSGSAIPYEKYLEASVKQISAGSGISKSVFEGTDIGKVTGAEVNERSVFEKIHMIERHSERIMRKIIKILKPNFDKTFDFEWYLKYRADPEKEAQINKIYWETEAIKASLEAGLPKANADLIRFKSKNGVLGANFNIREAKTLDDFTWEDIAKHVLDKIDQNDESYTSFAKRLSISKQTLYKIVNGVKNGNN
ncbi:MAG: hypothetical protein JRJ62_01530 [Deltaproteobacteria bacterium]|nr:hypothetical protein [Deltaproteobacteria bacterium]